MAPFKRVNIKEMQKSIWLVKLPRYISDGWKDLPDGSQLGYMKIERKNKQKQVVLQLKPDTSGNNTDWSVIPTGIPMNFSKMEQVGIAISECRDGISCVGSIGQKLEVRPRTDDQYMSLKAEKIKKAQEPEKVTKLLDKIVNSYKPVSEHKEHMIDKQKKREQKLFKKNDDEVRDKLFSGFERHQYYNIKDLVKLTQQPIAHLKKLLQEYCIYNFKGTHKFTWELKPEYRHYSNAAY